MNPEPPVSSPSVLKLPSVALRRFVVNTLWGWITVIVTLATGILLAPFMIRTLGSDGYGIWSLAFSVVGYYTLLDFGFRSAVITFTAREAAVKNYTGINEVLSTALAYSAAISILASISIVVLASRSAAWFHIHPPYANSFPILFTIVGSGAALSFCFTIISGCLEGFQRFAALSRVQSGILALRSIGYFLVLWSGGGLIGLALCTLASAVALWTAYCILLHRTFPQLHLRLSMVRSRTLWKIARYGLHTSTNGAATIGLEQTPPVLIARELSTASVGYYSLALRLLQIPIEIVHRASILMLPITAEHNARKEHDQVLRMGILGNRYSFVLYAPFALLILTWGTEILRWWVGPEYAANTGPLLKYFVIGSWLALAGQNASIGLLFGINAHAWCAWGLVGEGVFVVTACLLVVHKGLVYVAIWSCIAMLANRGLFSAWIVCMKLHYSLGAFLWSIYGRALAISVPVYALLWSLARVFVHPRWWAILLAGVVSGIAYLLPAFFLCIEKSHRHAVVYWSRQALERTGIRWS